MATTLTAKRFWKLREGIGALLAARRVSGDCLRVIIGHCTFAALLVRPLLSCFHDCYRFVEACGPRAEPLWKGCRSELTAFRGCW